VSDTILVTGAAGFAGSHLLELLARERRTATTVVAWHREGSRAAIDIPGVSWQSIDLMNAPAVRTGIARIQPAIVYHCAGAAHVGRSWNNVASTFATNVKGTHHLLEGLRASGHAARVVIPGSAMIYKPANEPLSEDHEIAPPSPYGLSKLAQELLGVRASVENVSVVIGRSFNHIGPRQDAGFAASGFARQIAEIEAGRRDAEVVVGNLDARRDITDVRDTVRAYHALAARGQPRRAYNVASGRAWAIGEILDMLAARAKVPIRVRVDPGRFRPNDLPSIVGDARRIREEVGWAPAIPIPQTLDDLLEYWRKALA